VADEDLLVRIGINDKQYASMLARMNADTERRAKNIDKAFAKQNRNFVRGVQQANRAAGGFASGGLRQIGMQLSQVAQQGAATGDYFKAMSIQAADIGLAFGGLGIAVGAALTVLGPFVAGLIQSGDSAEMAGKGVENFTGSIKSLQNLAAIASGDIADLRKEFGDFAEEVQRGAQIAARAALSQAMGSLTTVSTDLIDNLDQVYTNLLRVAEAQKIVDELRKTGGGPKDDFLIAAEENLRRMQDEARAAAEAVGLTTLQAINLKTALGEIAAAGDIQSVAAAAEDALAMIDDMFPATSVIPPEVAKITSELQEVLASAGRGVVAMGEVAEATGQAADSARVFVGEISGADLSAIGGQAAFLAQQMGIAAAQARAYNDALNADAGLPTSPKTGLSFGLSGAATSDPSAGNGFGVQSNLGFGDPRGYGLTRVTPLPKAPGKTGSRGGGGGGRSAEDKQRTEWAREAARYIEQTRTELELYNAELELLETLNAKGFFAEAPEAYARAVAQVEEEFNRLQFEDLIAGIDSVADAMAGAIVNGEDLGESMRQILRQMAADIVSSGIRQLLMSAFGLGGLGGGGGGLLGAQFGGFRAAGGPVSAGRAYVVGERGPEIMVPGASGQIIPNGGFGGSVTMRTEVINNVGAQISEEREVLPDGTRLQRFVVSEAVADGFSTPGGAGRRTLRAMGVKGRKTLR
jgi:hypothetical protein